MRKLVIMMIMGVALMALPALAQEQEWKSTSAMQTSGSAYTPQVNAVGATGVAEMATTTNGSSASTPNRAKRSTDNPGEPAPEFHDEDSPIGDAVLPLLLFAGAFLIWRAARPRAVKE